MRERLGTRLRHLWGHGGQRSVRRWSATTGLLSLALASFVAGAAGATAETTDGERATFTVGLTNQVDSFNPFLGIEAESFEMWALTYDYLIGYSMEDMSPVPALATEWSTSEDGLEWTFDIREGVTWSDGEPLTAADVAYTLNRVLTGEVESATWAAYLDGVDEVTAPDDTTVVLTLGEPNATLPLIPVPIVPEHIWQDISAEDVASFAAEPSSESPIVGSGPFRFVEGQAGGSLYRFEKNPDYWQGAPHIDEVVFRVYQSEDPAVQALLTGEIDFVDGVSALQVESLQGRENVMATNGDAPGFDEIAFNTGAVDPETEEPIGDGNPALQDPAFRRALGYAVDRQLIIDRVYQGAGQPGISIVPPAYSTFLWEPAPEDAYTFDLERAGELLDEAGYTLGADGLRTMPGGEPIGALRLFARSDSKTSLDTLNYFQEWLGELGIEATVTSVDSSNLTDIILEGNFDVFQWGWYVEPDPHSMLSYLTCDQRGDWSDAWYCSEEYDALYEQQRVELDEAARVELIKRMQEILYQDAPYIVTAYSTNGQAVRSDRFTCFTPQPNPGGVWLMQYGAYNYLNARPTSTATECPQGAEVTIAAGAGAGADGGGEDGAGVNLALLIGAGALVVAAGAGAVALSRRRGSAGDRE